MSATMAIGRTDSDSSFRFTLSSSLSAELWIFYPHFESAALLAAPFWDAPGNVDLRTL